MSGSADGAGPRVVILRTEPEDFRCAAPSRNDATPPRHRLALASSPGGACAAVFPFHPRCRALVTPAGAGMLRGKARGKRVWRALKELDRDRVVLPYVFAAHLLRGETGDADRILNEFGIDVVAGGPLDAAREYWVRSVVRGGAAASLRYLREGGLVAADDVFGDERESLLHLACDGPSEAVFRYAMDIVPSVNARSASGLAPLHVAVANGRHEYVEILLDNGATASIQDNHGTTPLLVAVNVPRPQRAVVALLVNRGMINQSDHDGDTPLHLVVNMPGTEFDWLVQLLLDEGADPNKANEAGLTPLHALIRERAVSLLMETTAVLLDAGADPNRQDTEGNTALHYALKRGASWKFIKLLMEYGASPLKRNIHRISPREYAKGKPAKVQEILANTPPSRVPGKGRRRRSIIPEKDKENEEVKEKVAAPISLELNLDPEPEPDVKESDGPVSADCHGQPPSSPLHREAMDTQVTTAPSPVLGSEERHTPVRAEPSQQETVAQGETVDRASQSVAGDKQASLGTPDRIPATGEPQSLMVRDKEASQPLMNKQASLGTPDHIPATGELQPIMVMDKEASQPLMNKQASLGTPDRFPATGELQSLMVRNKEASQSLMNKQASLGTPDRFPATRELQSLMARDAEKRQRDEADAALAASPKRLHAAAADKRAREEDEEGGKGHKRAHGEEREAPATTPLQSLILQQDRSGRAVSPARSSQVIVDETARETGFTTVSVVPETVAMEVDPAPQKVPRIAACQELSLMLVTASAKISYVFRYTESVRDGVHLFELQASGARRMLDIPPEAITEARVRPMFESEFSMQDEYDNQEIVRGTPIAVDESRTQYTLGAMQMGIERNNDEQWMPVEVFVVFTE